MSFFLPRLTLLVAYHVLVNSIGTDASGIYLLATSISGALAFIDFGFFCGIAEILMERISNSFRPTRLTSGASRPSGDIGYSR